MSILDDAIREHLELKRKHGAASSEVERLEQEAFGPATRPDDPDFAETGPPAEAEPAAEAPAMTEEAPAQDVEPAAEGVEQPTASELARAEHPDLGDTADHPAPEVFAEADVEPAEPTLEPEPEPPEAPESSIFDGDDAVGFSDLDFELELEDDDEDDEAAVAAPLLDDDDDEFELSLPDDAAIEQALPPLEDEDGDQDRDEDEDKEPPSAPESEVVEDDEGDEGEGDEEESDEEDLLEETPDFLQDTPEGERLWFEQREPKDFDFDD